MELAIQSDVGAESVVSTGAGSFAAPGSGRSSEYDQLVLALLHQAADAGDSESQSKLGAMYARGDGVPLDYTKSLKYLLRAADRKHPLALYNLGVIYAHAGRYGIEPDPAKSFEYYSKAADAA